MSLTTLSEGLTGIRNFPQYRLVCLSCLAAGRLANNTAFRHYGKRRSRRDRICLTCGAEWSVSHCWSCQVNYVDSRDPEIELCTCGWLKCAFCGSCDWNGCQRQTNPYSRHFTYREAQDRRSLGDAGQMDDPEAGWASFVGVSHDDPDWGMMEEIAADSVFERSERD